MAKRAPIVEDITIVQGMAFEKVFNVTLKSTGGAFDYTNYTGRAQLRADKNLSSELRLTFTVTLDDPSPGRLKIALGATASNSFPGSDICLSEGESVIPIGHYDVEIELTGDPDSVIRIAEGEAFLNPNVTSP